MTSKKKPAHGEEAQNTQKAAENGAQELEALEPTQEKPTEEENAQETLTEPQNEAQALTLDTIDELQRHRDAAGVLG